MEQKPILSLLGVLVTSLMAVTLLVYALTMSAVAAEPGQATNPARSATPRLSPSQGISGTTWLFPDRPPVDSGGSDAELPTDEMSEQESKEIELEIERNIKRLEGEGKLAPASATVVTLEWPLKSSDTFADYGYHAIRSFVDHDPNYPDQVLDYYCGDRSYDMANGFNHTGTDFSLWPFPWNKMYDGDVQVVAAAPGVIVSKNDGNYDRSCSSGTDVPWNAVAVRHSDGSVATYGHLKSGSLTEKGVGSAVQTGEYLAIVGSSGRSGGPHLHLTLRDGERQIVDPYQGACNTRSPDSWWAAQRPYYDSAVNLITTGDGPPEFPSCPSPTITHIKDNFSPGDRIYFTIYYRDLLSSQSTEFTIYQPDDSIFQRVTYHYPNSYSPATYRYWGFETGSNAMHGTWRFEVIFEGQTYQTFFNVGDPTYITVTSPSAGDVWAPGSTQTIGWNDNLGGNVRLDLYRYGVYLLTIAKSIPSDGAYAWTIPPDIAASSSYQIRVVDLANDEFFGESDHFAAGDPELVYSVKTFLPMVLKESSGGEAPND